MRVDISEKFTIFVAFVFDKWPERTYFVCVLFSADFGVSAKNVSEKQKRDSFIGTPYW